MAADRHRAPWMHPAVYWGAAVMLILADVLAVALGWLDEQQVRSLRLSLVELAMQIAVVGIAGGLIKRAIDEQRAMVSFRLEVITALSEAHAKVYALRRALALRPDDPEVVRERVFELMDIRNSLGSIGHVVRTKRDVGQREVTAELATIRVYFEELIDEAMREAEDGQMRVGPELERFIAGCRGDAEAGSETYQRRFKAPYLRAKCAADPSWQPNEEQQRIRVLEPDPTSG